MNQPDTTDKTSDRPESDILLIRCMMPTLTCYNPPVDEVIGLF